MPPLARYAALNGYVDLAMSLGLNPGSLVRAARLDLAGLAMPDRWAAAGAIAELLERSAAESGCEDFGLRLADHRRLANLGPLSLVVREAPDLRAVVRLLIERERMYNEALRIRLVERDGIATIRVALDTGRSGDLRQSVELVVAVLTGLVRGFLGSRWHPLQVDFTHPAPRDRQRHRRVFGPHVAFDQEFNGILLYTADLDTKNAKADPQLLTYAERLLDSGAGGPAPLLDRARELIELLLPTGRCSVGQVARSLGVDRRTVHRKLAAEGHTFSSLIEATRLEFAERMVANPSRPLTQVSDALGFSAPSNFSRWFRDHFGVSPRQWRDAQSGKGSAYAGRNA